MSATTMALADLWRASAHPLVAKALREIGQAAAEALDARTALSEFPKSVPSSVAIPLLGAWVRKRTRGDAVALRVQAIVDGYDRDPRLSDLAIDLLANSPSKRSIPLDRAVWRLLKKQRDPRAFVKILEVDDHPHLRRGRQGWMADGVGRVFNKQLSRFMDLKGTPGWSPKRVPVEVLRDLRELLRAFRRERRLGPGGDSARELLEAILADPKEDGPRAVYADLLTTQGLPSGEFILLQLQEAAGTLDDAGQARMQQLFDAYGHAWAKRVVPDCVLAVEDFRRGFFTRARLRHPLLADPGAVDWWTVEEVRLLAPEALLALVEGRSFRSLHTVHGVRMYNLSLLADAHPRLQRLVFSRNPRWMGGSAVPKDPCGFRNLRELALGRREFEAFPWLTAGLARPLRRLRVDVQQARWASDVGWILEHREAMAKGVDLVVKDRMRIHFRRRDGGWSIGVHCQSPLGGGGLSALPREEVVLFCSEDADQRAKAARRFPNARLIERP
ncbi:MAG: TIGR02996 domain-containing protein [Myxococcota bacterium]